MHRINCSFINCFKTSITGTTGNKIAHHSAQELNVMKLAAIEFDTRTLINNKINIDIFFSEIRGKLPSTIHETILTHKPYSDYYADFSRNGGINNANLTNISKEEEQEIFQIITEIFKALSQ